MARFIKRNGNSCLHTREILWQKYRKLYFWGNCHFFFKIIRQVDRTPNFLPPLITITPSLSLLREDTHINVFFSVRTPKRGGGVKNPLTSKQKNLWFKNKLPEPAISDALNTFKTSKKSPFLRDWTTYLFCLKIKKIFLPSIFANVWQILQTAVERLCRPTTKFNMIFFLFFLFFTISK